MKMRMKRNRQTHTHTHTHLNVLADGVPEDLLGSGLGKLRVLLQVLDSGKTKQVN